MAEPTSASASMTGPESLEPIYQFFTYDHLREDLRDVSKPFFILAGHLIATLPRNPERSVSLRKLLESKDAAVRAKLMR